jgi:hypothetical protein
MRVTVARFPNGEPRFHTYRHGDPIVYLDHHDGLFCPDCAQEYENGHLMMAATHLSCDDLYCQDCDSHIETLSGNPKVECYQCGEIHLRSKSTEIESPFGGQIEFYCKECEGVTQ